MTIDTQRAATRTLSDIAAEEIRALLGRKRMSQAELARRLNANGAWLNYRLTGRQPIDLNDLQIIAMALEVKPSDLLGPGGGSVTPEYPRKAGQNTSGPAKRVDVKPAVKRSPRPPSYPGKGRRPQLLATRPNG